MFIDNLIAFDKPYQMAYTNAPNDQANLIKILQDVKRLACPKVDRLNRVNTLDKSITGIVLFTK